MVYLCRCTRFGDLARYTMLMDTSTIISVVRESLFMIVVFGAFLGLAMLKGRYLLVNIILGLYLALLISLKFPYFNFFLNNQNKGSDAVVMIVLFAAFTIVGALMFRRHIPGDDFETAFHAFGKKLLLAAMATVLVMAYSYHALPVTDLITPGSPIQSLFAPQDRFFWWLIAPVVALFFV